MKDAIMDILKRERAGCEYEYNQAKRRFTRYGKEQMDQEYGRGGETPNQILEGCRISVERITNMMDWLENV